MSALSLMEPVVLTLTWLSSLGPIGLPRVSTVVRVEEVEADLARGRVGARDDRAGELPAVSSEPVPVAGQRALATPLRHHGLKMRTGCPPIVEVAKLPLR